MENYVFKSRKIHRIDNYYEPFVYIIKEIETGIKYIGSRTAQNCLEKDLGTIYFTSSKHVKWENNEFEIVEIIPCDSNHNANILEAKIIKENDAVKSNFYYNKGHPHIGFNASGLSWSHSEETKKKLSKIGKGRPSHRKGKTLPEKTKERMSKSKKNHNHGFKGKSHSEKSIEKMRDSLKGENCYMFGISKSEEIKNKIRNTLKGRTHTEESKQKMKESSKKIKKKLCYFCKKEFYPGPYARYHGPNCKTKV